MKSLMFMAGAAVVAASLATGAPASASPVIPSPNDPAVMQTKVMLSDLDLSHAAGAETAAQRIRRAARAVCGGSQLGPYPLVLQSASRACVETSLRDALARLDHPLVTRAAYGEKAPPVYAAR